MSKFCREKLLKSIQATHGESSPTPTAYVTIFRKKIGVRVVGVWFQGKASEFNDTDVSCSGTLPTRYVALPQELHCNDNVIVINPDNKSLLRPRLKMLAHRCLVVLVH